MRLHGPTVVASALVLSLDLNPNRVPLAYRATLYRPSGPEAYVVRVRVFGNYE
jgi:hypothetical protein